MPDQDDIFLPSKKYTVHDKPEKTKDWLNAMREEIELWTSRVNQDKFVGKNKANDTIYYFHYTIPELPTDKPQRIADPMTGDIRDELVKRLERYYAISLPISRRDEIVEAVAVSNPFNPIEDFVNHLPKWDGKHRAESFLVDTWGVANNGYHTCVGILMLLSIVLRARHIDQYVKQDHMFVLTGKPGLGKSTFVADLMKGHEDLLDDSLKLNAQDNNALMLYTQTLVNEIAEMSMVRGSDVDDVKGFLSRRNLVFRAPYARDNTIKPFHNTLIGTTNNPQVLNDLTGNRKFIMIDVNQKRSDLQEMTQDYMDQLYAEVLYRYRNEWQAPALDLKSIAQALDIDDNQVNQMAVSQQRIHAVTDILDEVVKAILDNTPDDILPGLSKKLTDSIIKIDDQQQVVGINTNSLRTALDEAVMGSRTADAEDIKQAISKSRAYSIRIQKSIESNGFHSTRRCAPLNIDNTRGWFVSEDY